MGAKGFIEGRKKLPIKGGKWNLQWVAWWPKYDKKNGINDASMSLYPLQGYGEEIEDSMTATINGQVFEMDVPKNAKGKVTIPGTNFLVTDFVGDELVWRFDLTSKTPTALARPFLIAGELTLLRDSTTGDEGSGLEEGDGELKGQVLNAVDGKKMMKPKMANSGRACLTLNGLVALSANFKLRSTILVSIILIWNLLNGCRV